jgi:multisubunit Na+/H+ antiporter MnhF subunit
VRTVKVSWREAFRIFRHSVGPAIWERIVGLAIMCLVATFLVTVFKIWVALARLTK